MGKLLLLLLLLPISWLTGAVSSPAAEQKLPFTQELGHRDATAQAQQPGSPKSMFSAEEDDGESAEIFKLWLAVVSKNPDLQSSLKLSPLADLSSQRHFLWAACHRPFPKPMLADLGSYLYVGDFFYGQIVHVPVVKSEEELTGIPKYVLASLHDLVDCYTNYYYARSRRNFCRVDLRELDEAISNELKNPTPLTEDRTINSMPAAEGKRLMLDAVKKLQTCEEEVGYCRLRLVNLAGSVAVSKLDLHLDTTDKNLFK